MKDVALSSQGAGVSHACKESSTGLVKTRDVHGEREQVRNQEVAAYQPTMQFLLM